MRGLVGLLLRSLGADRCGPHEAELPDFLAEMIWGADGQDLSDLIKGAGHKYIRRIPKAGGGYRYFYNVTGGHGLGHHAEMVKDAAFKIRSRDGQEGHVHILEDHGDEVTLKHDESGREARIKKSALAAMLAREHAEALGVVKTRAAKTLEQARKTGTAKQQEKAAALVRKYGGDVGGRESVGLAEPVGAAEPAWVAAPVAEPEPAKPSAHAEKLRDAVAHALWMVEHVEDERDVSRYRKLPTIAPLLEGFTDAEVLGEVKRRKDAGEVLGVDQSGTLNPTDSAFVANIEARDGIGPRKLSPSDLERAVSKLPTWSLEAMAMDRRIVDGARDAVSEGLPKTAELLLQRSPFSHERLSGMAREADYLRDLFLSSRAVSNGNMRPEAFWAANTEGRGVQRWNGNGWDVYKVPASGTPASNKFWDGLGAEAREWARSRGMTFDMGNRYKKGLLPDRGRTQDIFKRWLLTQPAETWERLGLVPLGTAPADAPVQPVSPVAGLPMAVPKVNLEAEARDRSRDLNADKLDRAAKLSWSSPVDEQGRAVKLMGREGALAEVNALPRPAAKLETGSRWGDRRWVMGDVSVSASGPYAGGGSHVDSILERKWRAARMNERGFGDSFDGLTVRGPVEGGEGGTPTPKVEAALPAPVSGAGAELGRKIQEATLSEAPYLFSRKRPKQRVELERPLVGPSGAKLLAYEWQHKTVDDVDKRGEDVGRRVSDWDKAEVSPHTGREIVHHFEVRLPSGDVHTVSAESVADLLGYGSGRGASAQTSVRGLANAMIERGKVQQQIGELEPLLARYDAAHAANNTAKLPFEDAGLSRNAAGLLFRNFKVGGSERHLIAHAWDRMGDMERRSYADGLRAQERTRRAVEAIGQDPKTFNPSDAYQSLKVAQERAAKLDKRIEQGRKALERSEALSKSAQGSMLPLIRSAFGVDRLRSALA